MQVIESISLDICQLVLDYLSLADLVNLHHAYTSDIPKLAYLCKSTCQHRMSAFFTKSPEFRLFLTIDGERLNYKRFRDELFRQYHSGRHVQAFPFRAEFSQLDVERKYLGGRQSQSQQYQGRGCGKTQMCLVGELSQQDQSRRWENTYQPDYHGDGSYGPSEIVTCSLSFYNTSRTDSQPDDGTMIEKIKLEYDTRDIDIPKTATSETELDDGQHMLRTISHHLPLTRVYYKSFKPTTPTDNGTGGLKFDLPIEWAGMLGRGIFCTVLFKEVIRRYARHTFFPRGGVMEMQSVEVKWDVNLTEEGCRNDVIDLWDHSASQGKETPQTGKENMDVMGV
jgi:hypothetical protein